MQTLTPCEGRHAKQESFEQSPGCMSQSLTLPIQPGPTQSWAQYECYIANAACLLTIGGSSVERNMRESANELMPLLGLAGVATNTR